MNYAERADAAQQEQLDWLSQIAEELRKQTQLQARIARHTALLYGCAIVGVVLFAVWLLARLFDVVHG